MRLFLCFSLMMSSACTDDMESSDQEGNAAATPAATGLRPDAPTFALHGPFWVGHTQLETNEGLRVTAWYPARNAKRVEERITYQFTPKFPGLPTDKPLRIYGHAIADAPMDTTGGAHPLVIFSHGYTLNPEWYSTLVEHYASHGFVVLAPDHVEADWLEAWAASVDRTIDVKRTLSFAAQLAAEGEWAGTIDTSKVAVVGHSFGGYTALAMAGAQFDMNAFNARCAALAPDDPKLFLCAPFLGREADIAARAGLSSVPEGLWPSLGDSRVTAVISIAGDAFLFDGGLASMKVPMLAIGGTGDTASPFEWSSLLAYNASGSAQKTLAAFDHGEHMIATNECGAMPWTNALEPLYRDFVCLDPVWDKLRALDLINHFSTALLRDVMMGDAAARQALSSDAVQFPGIDYSTAP